MRQNDTVSTFLSSFDYLAIVEKRRSTVLGQMSLFLFHDAQLTAELKNIAERLITTLQEVKEPNDPNWHRWLENTDIALDNAFQTRRASFYRKYGHPPRSP